MSQNNRLHLSHKFEVSHRWYLLQAITVDKPKNQSIKAVAIRTEETEHLHSSKLPKVRERRWQLLEIIAIEASVRMNSY